MGMGCGGWRNSTSITSLSAHNTALNSSVYLAHSSQLVLTAPSLYTYTHAQLPSAHVLAVPYRVHLMQSQAMYSNMEALPKNWLSFGANLYDICSCRLSRHQSRHFLTHLASFYAPRYKKHDSSLPAEQLVAMIKYTSLTVGST